MASDASARSRWRTLLGGLAEPVDVASLVAFRVLVGLLLAVGCLRFMLNGWIEQFFLEPTFAFKYWGFSWVKVWSPTGMYLHFGALIVLGVFIAAGFLYHLSALLAFIGFTYLELMDVTYYLNHYYLLSLLLLLLAVMPLGRAASIDAWLRPARAVSSFPAWCLWLLRFQVAVVYFYAGVAKVSADWLLHAQPMSIWLAARTHLPLVGPWLGEHWIALAASWAGCLYDLTIWAWLSWARTRRYAFAAVVAFHVTVGLLFNIGMFPFIMIAAATVFFSPSWPRAIVARRARIIPPVSSWSFPRRPVLALMGLYVFLQVALPLRQYLYPGSVLWNEQGMRWAWNVLVREKNGAVTFYVTLPNGKLQIVTPRRYLTAFQEREMSSQPDLILQLAHHIADDYRRSGHGEVEVRAEARVSMNGRASVDMIDSSVDLARVADGLAPASWILPEPSSRPAKLASLRD